MDSPPPQIYFEQQNRFSNNCAIHTVNNLVGFAAFSTKTFDQICSILENEAKSIGYPTRTKHIMGGDYDINVIQKALENCGLQASWIDLRVQYKYKYERGTFPKGFILNIQSQQSILHKVFAYSSRHWVCIKLINCDYYLLDSKKAAPVKVEDIDGFLNNIKKTNGQVLEIRERIGKEKKIDCYEDEEKFYSIILDNYQKFDTEQEQLLNCKVQKETENKNEQQDSKEVQSKNQQKNMNQETQTDQHIQ